MAFRSHPQPPSLPFTFFLSFFGRRRPLNPHHSGPRLQISNFHGKVLLVSNVASGCTYTDNSYTQLNELHKRFQSRGLQVMGVPSDSFNQEPGTDDAIYDFVQ